MAAPRVHGYVVFYQGKAFRVHAGKNECAPGQNANPPDSVVHELISKNDYDLLHGFLDHVMSHLQKVPGYTISEDSFEQEREELLAEWKADYQHE